MVYLLNWNALTFSIIIIINGFGKKFMKSYVLRKIKIKGLDFNVA